MSHATQCIHAAQNWADTGAYWRSWYDIPDFQEQLENLYNKLKPLYNNLHAYGRKKLREQYGQDKISATGPIPAHVLGKFYKTQSTNSVSISGLAHCF